MLGTESQLMQGKMLSYCINCPSRGSCCLRNKLVPPFGIWGTWRKSGISRVFGAGLPGELSGFLHSPDAGAQFNILYHIVKISSFNYSCNRP